VASHTSVIAFFFYCFADPRDLHSFPTRRSSDLARPRLSGPSAPGIRNSGRPRTTRSEPCCGARSGTYRAEGGRAPPAGGAEQEKDRKSTRLNSSHSQISYAVFCLKKKKKKIKNC